MKRLWAITLSATVILALTLPAGQRASAQSQPYERLYQHSKSEVDKVLEQIHSSVGGRLPVLDGFVDTTADLNSYSRGYYQCAIEVKSVGSGTTLVRVSAKITAWHGGSGSAQGEYRVLPSNGRIEADLLDRIGEALGSGASVSSPSLPPAQLQSPPIHEPTSSASDGPVSTSTNQPTISPSAILRSLPPVGVSALPAAPPANSPASAATTEDLDSLRAKREKAERRAAELNADMQNLEELQRNQAHPLDLAVVRQSGTPLLASPESNARVLFRADAEDEFPIIDKQANWVHVRISGDSRGWIRRTEVDSPDGIAEPSAANGSAKQEPSFRVAREETNSFPGKWEPLHGKAVKIIWVEPSSGSATSSAEAKRSFAKSLFLKAYQEISATNLQVNGVVIVFDSADGGQVSATLSSLKQWQVGSLSEASFWKQCAVEPPELLEDSPKSSAGHL